MATATPKPKERELSQEFSNKSSPPQKRSSSIAAVPPSDPLEDVAEQTEPKHVEEQPEDLKLPDVEIALSSSSPSPLTPASDLQKKLRRAERFGLPVQLSEQEKRNSRAERFGTGFTLHGSQETRKYEEQKRKDRTERFGTAVCSATDEEAKKKARLARFATISKSDALEEDKRKARTIRFSQVSSTSSQENGTSSR